MSEEVLRIKLSELDTVRVFHPDGKIITVPTKKLGNYVTHMGATDEQRAAIVKLDEAILDIARSGVSVEFEIVIPKTA